MPETQDILFDITPEIQEYAKLCNTSNAIERELYTKYDVKRGLRDLNGKGVLAGLTNVSDVRAKKIVDGEEVPCEGNLYYRGYSIRDLVAGFRKENHPGFEEIAYLLLFGELPNREQLKKFQQTLVDRRTLPSNFVRDIIMKAPSKDMMVSISRSILNLYSYDPRADETDTENVLRQCLNLISQFPMLMVYSYHAYNYRQGNDLFIYAPSKKLSMAENILMMLREDKKYTTLEAEILDMALVLHMDHGGGNNSTFTTHVVTSSGTDTYSSTAASIGSLKGPRHGGANLKVQNMFSDLKAHVEHWDNEDEIVDYLQKVLNKEAFDHAGLIYGMGHAVYTLSDPREVILKRFAQALAEEKGMTEEFDLYDKVEGIAGKLIMEHRKLFKNVCANVDFYSGFVYSMLGIPEELFTPIFAIARMPGWSAHRLEELINANKIIRPAYKYVGHHTDFVAFDER